MTSPRDDLDRLIAEFTAQRQQLADAQAEMRTLGAKVTSAKNVLTVELGPGGEITELTFNNRDYRTMGPDDLGALVRDTIADARRQLADRMQASMGGLFGAEHMRDALGGLFDGDDGPLGELMAGNLDLQALLPPGLLDGTGDGGPRPDGKPRVRR